MTALKCYEEAYCDSKLEILSVTVVIKVVVVSGSGSEFTMSMIA